MIAPDPYGEACRPDAEAGPDLGRVVRPVSVVTASTAWWCPSARSTPPTSATRPARKARPSLLIAACIVAAAPLLGLSDAAAACAAFAPMTRWGAPFVKVFGGFGSRDAFSNLLLSPWDTGTSTDRLVAAATGTAIASAFCGSLTFEWEVLYAHHWGSQRLSEFGLAFNGRWNKFPWNENVLTTFAVGTGPSYATTEPDYEPHARGDASRWLNQLNLEMTFASPNDADLALLVRLQHRSGIFGTIGGTGSNYLSVGIRRQF